MSDDTPEAVTVRAVSMLGAADASKKICYNTSMIQIFGLDYE